MASGLALNGLAQPVQAADGLDFAYVAILAPETVTVINGTTKTVKFNIQNVGGLTADEVTAVRLEVAPCDGRYVVVVTGVDR